MTSSTRVTQTNRSAIALLITLALVGCSSNPSSSDATGLAPTTLAADQTTTVVDPSTPETATPPTPSAPASSTVPVATGAPTTLANPAPSSTPPPTMVNPPITIPPIVTLLPGVTFTSIPLVTSLTAKLTWTCFEAAGAGFKVNVTWATVFTDHIKIAGPGIKFTKKESANGSMIFPLECGKSFNVKVSPYAANGDQGATKTITIKVGPQFLIPVTSLP
jgi:hypothetical protein